MRWSVGSVWMECEIVSIRLRDEVRLQGGMVLDPGNSNHDDLTSKGFGPFTDVRCRHLANKRDESMRILLYGQ